MGKPNSELGHTKNVANLVKLQLLTIELGTLYQPANPKIKAAALNTFTVKVTENAQQFATALQPYKNAITARENTFKPLFSLSTRIVNSFKSLQLSENIEQNLVSMAKKLKGERIQPPKAEKTATEDKKQISVSQLSYDNQIANFEKIVAFLATHPQYASTEGDLSLTALKQYRDELKATNKLAATMSAKLVTLRKERNDLLYNSPTNVIDIATAIKDYLKSIKEAKEYYKAAVKLKFSTIVS